MTYTDRRRPSAETAEATLPQPGDAFSTTAAQPAHSPSCRCRGTGTIVVNVALADATVSDPRPCPEPGTARPLMYDTLRDRIGEVMPDPVPEHLLGAPRRTVRLRPIGGGCEWEPDLADVRPLRAELAAELQAQQP